jgi:hypothetical protein
MSGYNSHYVAVTPEGYVADMKGDKEHIYDELVIQHQYTYYCMYLFFTLPYIVVYH